MKIMPTHMRELKTIKSLHCIKQTRENYRYYPLGEPEGKQCIKRAMLAIIK